MTPKPLTLRQIAHVTTWYLSLAGHKTLDVLRSLYANRESVRALPLVRFAIVATLGVVLLQDNLEFSITVGGHGSQEAKEAVTAEPRAVLASAKTYAPQTSEAGLLGALFSSPSDAHLAAHDETALAVIERFGHVAEEEAQRFGLDAGVLLAAAIANTGTELTGNTNCFGAALTGTHESAWASWRAMSLSVAAATAEHKPLRRSEWVSAVAQLYPDSGAVTERLAFITQRYSL